MIITSIWMAIELLSNSVVSPLGLSGELPENWMSRSRILFTFKSWFEEKVERFLGF